eukprot:67212_1
MSKLNQHQWNEQTKKWRPRTIRIKRQMTAIASQWNVKETIRHEWRTSPYKTDIDRCLGEGNHVLYCERLLLVGMVFKPMIQSKRCLCIEVPVPGLETVCDGEIWGIKHDPSKPCTFYQQNMASIVRSEPQCDFYQDERDTYFANEMDSASSTPPPFTHKSNDNRMDKTSSTSSLTSKCGDKTTVVAESGYVPTISLQQAEIIYTRLTKEYGGYLKNVFRDFVVYNGLMDDKYRYCKFLDELIGDDKNWKGKFDEIWFDEIWSQRSKSTE